MIRTSKPAFTSTLFFALVSLSLVCALLVPEALCINQSKHPQDKRVLKQHPVHKDESVIIEDATNLGYEAVDTVREAAYLARDAVEVGLEKADAGIDKAEKLASDAAKMASAAGSKAKAKIVDAGQTLKHAGEAAKDKLEDWKDVAVEKGEKLAHQGKETIQTAAGAAKQKASEVRGKLADSTEDIKDSVKGTAKQVKRKVENMAEDVKESGEELVDDAKHAQSKVAKKGKEVKREAQSVWSRLWSWLWGGYGASSSVSKSAHGRTLSRSGSKEHAPAHTSPEHNEAFHKLQAELEQEAARNDARLQHQHVTDTSSNMGKKMQSGKETLQKTVKQGAQSLKSKADKLQDKAEEKWEDAKETVEESWEATKKTAKSVGSKVSQAGRELKQKGKESLAETHLGSGSGSHDSTVKELENEAKKTVDRAYERGKSESRSDEWDDSEHEADEAPEYQPGVVPRVWRWFWSRFGIMSPSFPASPSSSSSSSSSSGRAHRHSSSFRSDEDEEEEEEAAGSDSDEGEESEEKTPGMLRRTGSYVFNKMKGAVKSTAKTISKATEDLTADEVDFGSEIDQQKAANKGFFERWFSRKGRDTGSWLHWLTMLASGLFATGILGLTAYYYGWLKSPYYSEYRGRVLRAEEIPSRATTTTRATSASPSSIPKRVRGSRVSDSENDRDDERVEEEEEEAVVSPPISGTTSDRERVRHGARTAPARTATRKDDVSYAAVASSSIDDIDAAIEHQQEKLEKEHWTPSRAAHASVGGQELRSRH